jgi:hypothetical protein
MVVKKSSKKTVVKKTTPKPTCCGNCRSWGRNDSSGFYFLGFVGALIYYMSVATGFWSVVLGLVQAIVWPAMVVLHILGL